MSVGAAPHRYLTTNSTVKATARMNERLVSYNGSCVSSTKDTHSPIHLPYPIMTTKKSSFSSSSVSSDTDGYYDSHATTTTTTNNNNNNYFNYNQNHNQPKSNRAEFQSIPIHQSILRHIEHIGVGLKPQKKRKKLLRRTNKAKQIVGGGGGSRPTRDSNNGRSSGILDSTDEETYFSVRRERWTRSSTPGNGAGMTDAGRRASLSSSALWLPPPPFSSFANRADPNSTYGSSDQTIRRLPVKILGSAGTVKDDMPRSSKGLPEIAIAGRSNVGKSTLLNALLYGNLYGDDDTSKKTKNTKAPKERKYERGKTPIGTKLAKGKKAIVSTKPGETKRITFYQLSSSSISSSYSEYDTETTMKQQERRRQPSKNPNTDTKTDHHHLNKTTTTQKLSLVIADLPGYGFAYTSESKQKEWASLMTCFLLHRGKSLKRILLLLDARHGFKNADFEFLDMLQRTTINDAAARDGYLLDSLDDDDHDVRRRRRQKRLKIDLPPIQIVLTKCDLVSQNDLARRVVQTRQQLSDILRREPSALPVMLVSAKAGIGFGNIRGRRARGGILELQRELAGLVPR